VSDACDRLGVEAVRTGVLRPLWPGCPAVSGRVTTARLVPAEGAPSPLADLLDVLAGAARGVLLVDLGGRVDVQCWGSVLATLAAGVGVRGALVNGAARDVDGLQSLGFPTFARGVYPGGMRGRLRLAAVDEPVDLDGQTVPPGAVAVADASGLVVVPAERFEEAAQAAAALRVREHELLRAVEAGADARSLVDDAGEAHA
jgi:regulator of RNase E activity RraA